ncbi:hypothetical protein ACWEPC_48005 [Nonomuraea sp. NPDC004297]
MRVRFAAIVSAAALAVCTSMLTTGPADAATKWPRGERCGAFVDRPYYDFVLWKHCTSGRSGVKIKADLKQAFDRTYCVRPNQIKSIGAVSGVRKATIVGRC